MQRTMFISAIIIALSLSILGQMPDKMDKTEQAIMAVANNYANAIVKRDTSAMERILADDYLEVLTDGRFDNKQTLLKIYKTPVPANAGKLEGIDFSDVKVRVFGDTAIMTGRTNLRGTTADGQAYPRQDFAMTATMVKQKGQWQIASLHASEMPMPKAAANSSGDTAKTEQSVMMLSAEYAKAFVKRDAAAMEKLLADNFIQILPNGSSLVKADYINNYKAPLPANSGTLDMPELSSPKVNMFGDTAIMTARVSTRSQDAAGKTVNEDFLYTMTAIENNGRWQIAGLQSIEIPSRTPPAGMGNQCKFDKGPRAGQTQDYSHLKPVTLGTNCGDGRGSTGKVVAP